MTKQKNALYLTQHIRHCEQKALDEYNITEEELLLSAGTAAFHSLISLYPETRSLAIFCGTGNNAGDGYVLARLASEKGLSVFVHQHKTIEELPPVSYDAALAAIDAGIFCQSLDDAIDSDVDVLVDALLGIGLHGVVRGPLAQAIHLMNDSGLPIVALDVPSGLDADTGCVHGTAICASATVTFIAPKLGLYTMDGPDHCAKIICHSLALDSVLASIPPAAYRLTPTLLSHSLPHRLKHSQKGTYGHVLIIGGGPGMPGAAYLAAHAAFRVGAGTVTVATLPEHAKTMLPLLPEAMIYPIDKVDDLHPLLTKATVCVIGPGLGESEWAEALFHAAMSAQLPLVIDASALHLLTTHPQHDDNWVLTPHPGEAAGLLASSVDKVQQDRCKAAQLIQHQYGGCVVLKGVGSVIATSEHELFLCTDGNPGMAKAGMGDVLSGVIGGLLAQGVTLSNAAKLGVWLHAHAADKAVKTFGERGLMASDLMTYLGSIHVD